MDLGVLKRDFQEWKALADILESKRDFYETRAHNIAMGYLIWERVFFFAVSQISSSLNCVRWWLVLGLSLSSTFVYFLIFLEAVIVLYRTQNHLDVICKKQTKICERILKAVNQDDGGLCSSMEAGDSSDGLGFNFSFQVRILDYDSFRIVEKRVYICGIGCALFAVTVFELFACKYLLCH